MKIINLTISILLSIGMLLGTNSAKAEQRVKIFEMAESGQTIEFQMTPEEIASEDAENARLAGIRQAKLETNTTDRRLEFAVAGRLTPQVQHRLLIC